MPIIFDDKLGNFSNIVKLYTPKFFDSSMTGSGGKTGVFSLNSNPSAIMATHGKNAGPNISLEATRFERRRITNGDITKISFPIAALEANERRSINQIKLPPLATMTKVGEGEDANGNTWETYADLQMYSVVQTQTRALDLQGNTKTYSSNEIVYRLTIYNIEDLQSPTIMRYSLNGGFNDFYTINPGHTLISWLESQEASQAYKKTGKYIVDRTAVNNCINNWSSYAIMTKASEVWQETIDEILLEYVERVYQDHYSGSLTSDIEKLRFVDDVKNPLRRLENYKVPLDVYRKLYKGLKALLPAEIVTTLTKQNLNLLLSDTLNNLDLNRNNLQCFTPDPNTIQPTSLRRFSPEQIKAITSTDPLVLVQAGAGTGKALPLYAKVLTPQGYRRMGDLQVGDEVIGSSGKPTKIVRIHEQGLKEGYELTFNDGSQVEACSEHLWRVDDESSSKVITTEEWINTPDFGNYYLPTVEPVKFAEKELPLDPYFLGALLANAKFERGIPKTSSFNKTKDFNFDKYKSLARMVYHGNPDDTLKEVTEAAHRSGFSTEYHYRMANTDHWVFNKTENSMQENTQTLEEILEELNLNGAHKDKFIPEQYLFASPEQRLALIQGLFDNNGLVLAGRNYPSFIAPTVKFANDVLQMLWSLGIFATKEKQKHAIGEYWLVNVLSDHKVFKVSRYREKAGVIEQKPVRSLLKWKKIKATEMRCIEVDAPDHLYVIEDYIVTHNSTVILGRIDYLCAAGVTPEDITVLSFTNAAADNISEKNPRVNSMTIARMIHSIYEMNFPHHVLSTADTLKNTLDIYYPPRLMRDPVIAEFQIALRSLIKGDSNAFTILNNFVEDNYDRVIEILDTVKQTTLELEIIICYQRIGALNEPDHVKAKYLIIDEVQDNSIFEFIYTMKYVEKNQQNLFIVGDSAQTLYEFRASNPRALNIMEASGIFSSYQLQTNYRSNQEILDFANVALADIEANQFAKIQLQANSLAKVTPKTFTDKVKVNYTQLSKMGDLYQMYGVMFNKAKDFIEQKLNNKEQVAFLTFTRNEVAQFTKWVEANFPNAKIANLIPERMHNSTVLSNFIRQYWQDIKFAPTNLLLANITTVITSKMPTLTYNMKKQEDIILKMLSKWRDEAKPHIDVWHQQCTNGRITKDEFMLLVRDQMLNFEIEYNAIRQTLLSERNKLAKQQQAAAGADIVVSTIHSAKGLEFENTVVLYRNDHGMNEETKRMYYVALTRAMKAECILAYDTVKSPRIVSDYEDVVSRLQVAQTGGRSHGN